MSPLDQIADCVINNTQKVDWLTPVVVYQGAESCPTPDYWIASQALSIALSLFIAFIIAVWGPPILDKLIKPAWSKIRTFICRGRPKLDTVPETPKSIWKLEDKYVLKANDLIGSVGGDLLAVFLTIVVTRASGQAAFLSERNTMWDMFLFYTIRPRVAPFTGLLGFMKGWSSTGFADVIADGLLSFIAGSSIAIEYCDYYWHPPANPAAPDASLKILAIGAIMTALPSILALLLAFFISLAAVGKGGILYVIALFFAVLLLIFICLCLIPLIAIYEICLMLKIAFLGRKDQHLIIQVDDEAYLYRITHKLEMPINLGKWFRYVYAMFVFFSWVINVGNWLFFASYLILEGEAYCPSGGAAVTAIWVLVPVAVKFPVKALGWYIS